MSEGLPGFSLFIGVGHPFRRDDGVGPWLADRLLKHRCNAVAYAGDGTGLITLIGTASDVLVADAMQGGGQPGSIVLLDARTAPLSHRAFRNSTHEFGLVHAVETARVLGLLPRSIWIVGIEGQDFGFGDWLTPPVREAASGLLPALVSAFRSREGSG